MGLTVIPIVSLSRVIIYIYYETNMNATCVGSMQSQPGNVDAHGVDVGTPDDITSSDDDEICELISSSESGEEWNHRTIWGDESDTESGDGVASCDNVEGHTAVVAHDGNGEILGLLNNPDFI